MSGHNADFSIPRGDRDDVVTQAAPEKKATARKPEGLEADIETLQRSIDEAQLAVGELKLARGPGEPGAGQVGRVASVGSLDG